MVTTEDKLIEILSSICDTVIQQGSLPENADYPKEFFTFWNFSSDSESFYDNVENATVYEYSICFYSRNPERVYEVLRNAIKLLRENGFIASGDGHDVASDDVNYTGRGIDVTYRLNVKENG